MTKKYSRIHLLTFVASLCLLLSTTTLTSTPTDTKKKLPTAAQIIEESIIASGEKFHNQNIQNLFTKGTYEVVEAGLKLSVINYQVKPDKFYSIMESEATGKIERGFNSEIMWENSSLNGASIYTGKEREFLRLTSMIDFWANWKKYFYKVELNGEETVEGNPCYKITLYSKNTHPIVYFIDQKSKLPVKTIFKYMGDTENILVSAVLSDYKKIGNFLAAGKIKTEMLGRTYITTFDTMKVNVELPPHIFDIPIEVQALLKKKKIK